MKNTWKKAAAFTLALALVAGAAPANVGTGGLFGGSAIVANAATTVTTIDQLKNASGSVVIGADIEYSEYTFWYYEKNNVDIDLNGHTITLAKAYFGVDNGHTLTIRDSKGDGKILMKRAVRVLNGNVILEGGTLESNYNSGAIGISAGTFTMNGGTITGPKSIQCLVDGSVIINGGNVNGEFNGTGTGLSITGGIFNFDVTSLVNAGVSVTKIGNLWYVGDSAPSIVDISTATVNLAADNSVESITVGDDTITDLSGFDITYGVSDTDHTATSVPTAAGTYYAYVTAKDTNASYTGTAKSASFEVTSLEEFNSSTATNPTLTFTEDFTGNVNITRDDGVIDLNGHTINGNLMIQNNDPDKTVTIKNGTVTGELDSLAAWDNFFKGKVVLEDLTVSGNIWTDGHDYTIKSGTYNGVIYALKNDETTGITTITGGTFNNRLITGYGNPVVGGGTFSVSGGTFTYRPLAESMAEGYNTRWDNGSYVVTTDELNEVTSKITNPSFENGTTGWDITASEDTGSRDTNNNIYWMTGSSGNNLFNTWPVGKISQTVTGLANGKYKLEVVAASTENFKVAVSANNVTSEITAAGDHNGIFTTVEFNVTDGTANISAECLDADGLNNGWFKVDDFRLFYVAPTISNASVTLGDDLALNFYVDNATAETANDYTVKFTGACVDESSALAYNAEKDKYYATTHVYAKNINQPITAQLYKGEEAVGAPIVTSISDYLTALKTPLAAKMAANPTNPDALTAAEKKLLAMVSAAQLFGDASAAYFNPTETINDTSVAAEITAYMTQANISDAALTAMAAQYAPTFDSDAAKLSLVLDSKTAARLYVKDDTTGTESAINATKADYPSYHEVAGLLPQNLADEQTITVGETEYKFSALTWCYRVLTNGSASQKNINMAKAIMAYYEAAKNYTAPANPYAAAKVGDVVSFGNYDWYVINKRDDGVTLLMKESFTNKKYHDSYTNVITWGNCSLRTYLNGDFYNSFSADDKAKIVKTSITNPNNPDYGTNGGNNTEDYIYLLSIDELKALDNINSSIKVNSSWWWLRSPGSDSQCAAYVNEVGNVIMDGRFVCLEQAVRPALNLKF